MDLRILRYITTCAVFVPLVVVSVFTKDWNLVYILLLFNTYTELCLLNRRFDLQLELRANP